MNDVVQVTVETVLDAVEITVLDLPSDDGILVEIDEGAGDTISVSVSDIGLRGAPGQPGPAIFQISDDPGNEIENRPDGVFAVTQWKRTDW